MIFQKSFFFWSMVLLLGLSFQRTIWAQEILDQEHAPSGGFPSLAVAIDRSQIQTFTVGSSGILTRIEVQIAKEPQTVEDIVLSLWSTDALGLPAALLATASLPPSAIAGIGGTRKFTSFDLSSAALRVSNGEVYAIVLDSNASNFSPFVERYEWELGGQYERGVAYTKLGESFLADGDDLHFKTYVDSEKLKVSIDIKPGKFPNRINLKSKEIIPVAILTTESSSNNITAFDAATVNPKTARFGSKAFKANPIYSNLKDVDKDGDIDLILYFKTKDTGIKCGDTSAFIKAKTYDGQVIQGNDSIVTVGCKHKQNKCDYKIVKDSNKTMMYTRY